MTETDVILYDSRYGTLTPEAEEQIRKTRESIEKMQKREVVCPACKFRIEELYGIAVGIIQVKCQKCKLEAPLDLAYFRRIKPRVRLFSPYRLKRTYR